MNILLTFDVEVWCGGWNRLDEVFPSQFRRYVYGSSSAGDYALPKTLEMLSANGLKGVFFVEPLFAARFGLEHLATIVDLVRQAGQDVQLHLHPEWVDEIDPPLITDNKVKRQHLSYYTLDEQTALVRAGVDLIEAAGGGRATAFRAGSFACNRDTFRALSANDLLVDSSLNRCYSISGGDLRESADLTHPSSIEGVTSHPVGLFVDGFGRLRPAQLAGCSFAELRQAMLDGERTGRREFVIVSHNFEMLKSGLAEPDQVVVKRFDALCRFLGEHRDMLPTTLFPAGRGSDQVPQPRLPRSSVGATFTRHAEQLRRRMRERA